MKIFLMVDAEGISGIYESEQVALSAEGTRYYECQENMTADINVCVEAFVDAGTEAVLVRDAHGKGSNILWSKLSPKAKGYVIGRSGEERFPHLSEYDAVALLGYHAMAGTPGAILEHTMSSKGVQNYWLNGVLAGEIAIDAAIAGTYGKPVIMVSGDDKACAEARAILPWVVTAEVKEGLSAQGGILLPRETGHALLREKAREAVRRFGEMKPYVVPAPVRLRVEVVERGNLPRPSGRSYMKIIDGRTYEVTADTVEDALYRL